MTKKLRITLARLNDAGDEMQEIATFDADVDIKEGEPVSSAAARYVKTKLTFTCITLPERPAVVELLKNAGQLSE